MHSNSCDAAETLTRHKLGQQLLEGLQADFEQNGPAMIANVRVERPHDYLKIIAAVLPNEMKLDAGPVAHYEWSTAQLEAVLNEFLQAKSDTNAND